jgi:hypothetical protein
MKEEQSYYLPKKKKKRRTKLQNRGIHVISRSKAKIWKEGSIFNKRAHLSNYIFIHTKI